MKPAAIVKRLWNSPTLTTGASLATRTLNSAVILWLALAHFTPEEIVLWQLLASILALQLLLDLGLTPTFSRLIAFALGRSSPDWTAIAEIWSTMTWIYRRLTVAALLLAGSLGTLSLLKPVAALPDPSRGWVAWIVVLAVSPITFAATPYAVYLQGLNQVALLRRWETITGIGVIASSLVVLLSGGGVLALVVNTQVWALIGVWRNRRMALAAADGKLMNFPVRGKVAEVFSAAWPVAWRSGLGVMIAAGFVQLTGVVYAQIGEPTRVAAYLLALRFISAVNQFSQAPFYSKLPMLAQLQAQGKTRELLAVAQRGMRLALWVYVGGVTFLAFALKPALALIHSAVSPPAVGLWWLLAAAFFAERFGAMHLHLYSVTNRIVWHIVNGISGAITVGAVLVLYPLVGVYAFPLSLLAGYCGFYCWYSARKVYVTFQVPFLQFERTSGIPAVIGLLAAAVLHWLLPA